MHIVLSGAGVRSHVIIDVRKVAASLTRPPTALPLPQSHLIYVLAHCSKYCTSSHLRRISIVVTCCSHEQAQRKRFLFRPWTRLPIAPAARCLSPSSAPRTSSANRGACTCTYNLAEHRWIEACCSCRPCSCSCPRSCSCSTTCIFRNSTRFGYTPPCPKPFTGC